MSDEKLPQEENETQISSTETKQETHATPETDESEQGNTPDSKTASAEENVPEKISKDTGASETSEANSKENKIEEAMVEEKKAVESASEKKPLTAENAIDEQDSDTSVSKDISLEKQSAETSAKAATSKNEEENEEEDEEEIESSEDQEKTDEEEEEKAQKDYSALSKKDLVAEFDKLLKSQKVQDIKTEVDEIRSEFNDKFNEEMEHKKEEFLAEGGNIIDFHYSTPLKKDFNSLYFEYKEKRNNHYKNLKKDLEGNLNKRWELIEELKGLLSAEENINTTYKHFKEIQEGWHTAGAIPRDKYNTVWNTYHHHVENFYDFLHLNREFRDLDFKHNLDAKLKLITRAEELAQEEDINKAFRELQMLHKMWKEDIGPVAKEYRDEVWDKFSDATKVIHDKRQDQLVELEKEFETNYDKKKEVIEEIMKTTEETAPSHKGWQNAIKKVQDLRDAFFTTGRVPRNNNKEIWKTFKEATGNFNHQKNKFYKNQKKEQYTNLEMKLELIKTAEENKDGEDFEVITPLMKNIQNEWKNIGHVPRKDSDKIWKQFKKACNHYFDRVHAQKNEASKEETANFEAKEEMLKTLANFELTGEHKTDIKAIKENINAWKEIGRVPYNQRNIEQKFNKTLDGLFSKLDIGKKEKELIKFDNKLNTLVNREDDRKLQNEHFFISKKIEETRDDIRQLENNLGFFHHVDENNPLVREVHNNIARHKEQLEVWKAKLTKIKEIREE